MWCVACMYMWYVYVHDVCMWCMDVCVLISGMYMHVACVWCVWREGRSLQCGEGHEEAHNVAGCWRGCFSAVLAGGREC